MAKGTCSIEGCESPTVGRGWCDKHWRRWRTTGDPMGVKRNGRPPITGPCGVEDCPREMSVRGWCSLHYGRWRKTGDPLGVMPRRRRRYDGDPPCAVPECDRPASAGGWCKTHYTRWYKYGDPLEIKRRDHRSSPEPCSIEGCGRPTSARGWCVTHRWYRNGDPLTGGIEIPDPTARFWARVNKNGPIPRQAPDLGPCWDWIARSSKTGYGQFKHRDYPGTTGAHRIAYLLTFGSVPPGLHLDHLCRRRGCVNPAHLEPVTTATNVLRGNGPAARNARKTHCPQGHEYTFENTYVSARGGRICRACHREHARGRTAPDDDII